MKSLIEMGSLGTAKGRLLLLGWLILLLILGLSLRLVILWLRLLEW